MIDKKDLRIGNWVYYDIWGDGKAMDWIKISAINRTFVESEVTSNSTITGILFEKLLPIPITSERLEKCGFEEGAINLTDTPNLESNNPILWKRKWVYILLRERKGHEHCEYWINCEYLHQLQNLFFVLTRNELKLK